MIVSAVVAIAENNAIGKDNQLLWHIPADLKYRQYVDACSVHCSWLELGKGASARLRAGLYFCWSGCLG